MLNVEFRSRGLVKFLVVGFLLVVGTSIFWVPWFSAWRTRTLLDLGKLDAAELWLARSEWLGLDKGQADFFRAKIASRRGQPDEAVAWLRMAAEAGYSEKQIDHARKVLLAQAGRFEELGPDWVNLLNAPGADADGIYRGFVIYALACGLLDDAEKVVACWLEQSPENAMAYLFAGLTATLRSDWEAATKAYQQGLQFRPNDREMLAALAGCFSRQLQFQEAADVWQQLIDMKPTRVNAVVGLADCQSRLGNPLRAEQILTEHLGLVKQDAKGLALLGRVCLEQGKAGDAVTWYEQAATRQPESTDIRRSLAQAYRLSGQMESANALEPLLKEGERALAEIRKLNGQLNQNPGDADIRFRLGELTWRWQNRREGLNWMKVVLRVDPEHLEAQRFLAEHATEGEAADGEPRVGLLGRLPENP